MRVADRPARVRAQARPDGVLAVAGDLTFETVPDVYAESRAWFERAGGRITVDLAEVQRADSAGLALLIEWLRRAQARRVPIAFVDVPEQLQSLARVHGVGRALGPGNDNAAGAPPA